MRVKTHGPHGVRRVNAHGVRCVRACVRALSAQCVRVRTLAGCAACARADARGVRRVRVFASRPGRSGLVRPFLRFGCAEPVSNGSTSLGSQGCRASPAVPAALGACAKLKQLEPRGGQKLFLRRAEK